MLDREDIIAIYKSELENNKDIDDTIKRHRESVKGARARVHWQLQTKLTDDELKKLTYEQGKALWQITEKLVADAGLKEEQE